MKTFNGVIPSWEVLETGIATDNNRMYPSQAFVEVDANSLISFNY